MTLFGDALHDPGGKVRTRLPAGMYGCARFHGDRHEYRILLERWWDCDIAGGEIVPYVLWVGMNPSTATAEVNDPTVTREIGFTRAWGFKHYVKMNVMDYRATKPAELLKPGIVPCSERNPGDIMRRAHGAAKVIACWGAVHAKLAHHPEAVRRFLHAAGVTPLCFGRTKNNSPRHPLYVAAGTEPLPYPLVEAA